MKSRLYIKYKEVIAPKLKTELGFGNVMEVPRVEKVVLNAGFGDIKDNKDRIQSFVEDFTQIVGQYPTLRKARKSEAGFNVRQGQTIGVMVTLRNDNMWTFLDKLINVALPRVRDFSGVKSTSFDKNGNYSLGISEHTIFPEVNPNTVKGIRSLQLTVVTSTSDSAHGKALLSSLGIPFKKGKDNNNG